MNRVFPNGLENMDEKTDYSLEDQGNEEPENGEEI